MSIHVRKKTVLSQTDGGVTISEEGKDLTFPAWHSFGVHKVPDNAECHDCKKTFNIFLLRGLDIVDRGNKVYKRLVWFFCPTCLLARYEQTALDEQREQNGFDELDELIEEIDSKMNKS